jgi:hypothetical protein
LRRVVERAPDDFRGDERFEVCLSLSEPALDLTCYNARRLRGRADLRNEETHFSWTDSEFS